MVETAGVDIRQIQAAGLTPESWSPYGWIPVRDTNLADGQDRLSYEWDDAHVNVISHARDEVPAVIGGLRCEMLFRHLTHTQVLTPLDVACVVAVAVPGADFGGSGDPPEVHAFVMNPLQTAVLHRGTWHWGPFPKTADEVLLLNVQGLRYAEDNEMVNLAELGLSLDILLG